MEQRSDEVGAKILAFYIIFSYIILVSGIVTPPAFASFGD
jgi:hypothetical protein